MLSIYNLHVFWTDPGIGPEISSKAVPYATTCSTEADRHVGLYVYMLAYARGYAHMHLGYRSKE